MSPALLVDDDVAVESEALLGDAVGMPVRAGASSSVEDAIADVAAADHTRIVPDGVALSRDRYR
jgi:hypothetical protein